MNSSFGQMSWSVSDPDRFIALGPFRLDLVARHTTIDARLVPVPSCCFDYLVTLLKHFPEPVSYQDLVAESQGEWLGRLAAQDVARMYVYLLRKAIEMSISQPRYVLPVDGIGYRLAV
jgi:DNA-binding response OmpR family regulator